MTDEQLTWAERLIAEAKQFDSSMFPPVGKAEPGEKVIGDCPEEAKCFFALAQFYGRECKRMKLDMEYESGPEEGEGWARYREMDQKNDALMELFWGMVNDGLKNWGAKSSIGIRHGWKVVESAPSDHRAQIAGLFGLKL